MVGLGVSVFAIGAAGYSLWILRRRKAMLRRHALQQRKVMKYLGEIGLKNPNTPSSASLKRRPP